jgi:hypothetical protein
MNNLIPWLPGYLQPWGTARAVTAPGTSVTPYTYNGEVQPPPRETFSKPAPRFGPTIEGEAIRPVSSAAAPSALDTAQALVSRRLLSLLGSHAGTLAAGADAALGPMGAVIAAGDGRGTNSADDMKGLTDAYAAARNDRLSHASPAGQVTSAPLPPPDMGPSANDQVANRFGGMQPPAPATFAERFGGLAPAVLAKGDMLQASPAQVIANRGMFPFVPMPHPRPQMAHATAAVPMPQPRPAAADAPAPTAPMTWFQRNAAMMRDPITGQFIDPAAAARAQAQQG